MSYLSAFNYGTMGGLIYTAVTEGYAAARLGRAREEAWTNFPTNYGFGGAIGVFLNTGVQAAKQFSACLLSEKATYQCTSATYLDITLLALPCILATTYLLGKVCPCGPARNYALLSQVEGSPV